MEIRLPHKDFRHGETAWVSVSGQLKEGPVLICKLPIAFVDDFNITVYPSTIVAQETGSKQQAVFRIILPKNLPRKPYEWKFTVGGEQLTHDEVEVVELRQRILQVTLDVSRFVPAKHELRIECHLEDSKGANMQTSEDEKINLTSTVIVPER